MDSDRKRQFGEKDDKGLQNADNKFKMDKIQHTF